MNKYTDLEMNILSCFLQRPELMEKCKLQDYHFKKHEKIWKFMKAFYNRYKTFDISLMVSVAKNKYRMVEYITWLLEKEPAVSLFDKYQDRLIELYNQNEEEQKIKEKIYEMATDLYLGNIDLENFKEKLKKLLKQY